MKLSDIGAKMRPLRLDPAKFLWFWTLMLCALPNIITLFTEPSGLHGRVAAAYSVGMLMLPVGFYILVMASTRRVGVAVWAAFPLLFLSAFQVVLLYLYTGRGPIAVDMWLNLLTTNSAEVGELLGAMTPIIVAVVVGYLPPLVYAAVLWRRSTRLADGFIRMARLNGTAYSAFGALMLCASLLMAPPAKDFRALYCDMYPVNVIYNAGLAVDRTLRQHALAGKADQYTFHARQHADSIAPGRILVMVIGETARADNFSVYGYSRPTSPELERRDGLVAFPRAMSESNTTHKSVPMLMSHLDSRTFDDSIYYVKGIAKAFEEAGWQTAFISNQRHNGSFIDRFGMEAQKCTFIKHDSVWPKGFEPMDHELLPLLGRTIAEADTARGLLVVLHTYGSHFRYDDRYPAAQAAFTVDGPLEVDAACRPRLLAAYDNTIRYTSMLLDSVMTTLERTGRPAAMLYTSDHGEDIFDDTKGLFLHASPYPTTYQVHVPFMVWTSRAYRDALPRADAALRRNADKDVSSSASAFHTMLSLGAVDTPVYSPALSVADTAFMAVGTRIYLNDHNESVPLASILR